MPKAAIISGILVKLPPNMANAGWDIDEDIVRKFAKAHGIKWDISFRYSSGRGTIGSHRVEKIPGGYRHRITLSQCDSEDRSRNTILHELCHAIQAEKEMTGENPVHFYSSISGAYCQEIRQHGYRNSRYEIEANNFAANNAEKWNGIIY